MFTAREFKSALIENVKLNQALSGPPAARGTAQAVKNTFGGWSVMGMGQPKNFKDETTARAMAEWMNSTTLSSTKGEKRAIREALCVKFGIDPVRARGLF